VALGVRFGQLSALTTDAQWRPEFQQEPSSARVLHKLLTLSAFSVYVLSNPNSNGRGELKADETEEERRGAVLGPVSPVLFMTLNTNNSAVDNDKDNPSKQTEPRRAADSGGAGGPPVLSLEAELSEIGVHLEESQLHALLHTFAAIMHVKEQHQEDSLQVTLHITFE